MSSRHDTPEDARRWSLATGKGGHMPLPVSDAPTSAEPPACPACGSRTPHTEHIINDPLVEPPAEAPSEDDFAWVGRMCLDEWFPVEARVALSRVLSAAKEAGRLRKELEYASDDLAFLDQLRARVEKLERTMRYFAGLNATSTWDTPSKIDFVNRARAALSEEGA